MPPINGNAMFAFPRGMGFQNILGAGFGLEALYSFVIIICSLMIYFGTKEIYELSSYKGIKYFRQAFLFFAIAYFFRSFIKFITQYLSIERILDFAPGTFGPLTLFLFIYFSSMAVFYLLYSVMWKKWNESSNKIYLFHALAITIALANTLSNSNLIYLISNLALLIIVIFAVYTSKTTTKNKRNNLYIIYLLLSIFWILNIVDILIPNFFQGTQLFIYLASTAIFLLILYKVIKKTGSE